MNGDNRRSRAARPGRFGAGSAIANPAAGGRLSISLLCFDRTAAYLPMMRGRTTNEEHSGPIGTTPTRGGRSDGSTPGRRIAGGGKRRLLVWAGLALVVAAAVIGWFACPVGYWVASFQHWVLGLGPWGVAIFALLFVATTLVLAPDWPLSIAAGFVYGFWALPIVLAAATVAASLSFLAARYLLRNWVRRLLIGRPRLAAIDRAVAEEGWRIVVLMRLSPAVPFNLQNYLFGATAVPFSHYVAATGVGIVPGSLLYVYLGALGKAARHHGAGASLSWLLFAVGLLATFAAAILVARKAKAKLDEAALMPAGAADRPR
jgi:uncharacterized membrane protein YdjX (TVP38/TMEM64 family)